MDLTNEQWEVIREYIPEPPRRADGRGRPRVESRRCLNGMLWILRTGAPWKDLPRRYGAYQTVHRRFQEWQESGVMRRLLQGLARDLHRRGGIDLSQGFVDGTFSPAKKGAPESGRPSVERAARSWSLETLLLFQSPLALEALRPPKSGS